MTVRDGCSTCSALLLLGWNTRILENQPSAVNTEEEEDKVVGKGGSMAEKK